MAVTAAIVRLTYGPDHTTRPKQPLTYSPQPARVLPPGRASPFWGSFNGGCAPRISYSEMTAGAAPPDERLNTSSSGNTASVAIISNL
jgi:hypothetical protein